MEEDRDVFLSGNAGFLCGEHVESSKFKLSFSDISKPFGTTTDGTQLWIGDEDVGPGIRLQ